MRDGITLYADIYRPDKPGRYPVLLMRQPYGKKIASTITYAHPLWYARQDYVVIIQDVRGRGVSEGEFEPFIREKEDGFDTVEWAAGLSCSDGQVGMYGFSYQGFTQWAAAAAAPPHLKAIIPAMCGADLYQGMFYPHGRLALAEHLPWAFQLARDTARRKGDEAAEAFCTLVRNKTPDELIFRMPVGDEHPILTSYFPEFYEWCSHTEYDGYWKERNLLPELTHSKVPALHLGGWYDCFVQGTLQSYETLRQIPGRYDRLMIGPWSHIPWGRHTGGVDHGPESDGNVHRLHIQWFDYWLKGKRETEWLAEPKITYFELGSRRWNKLEEGSPFQGAGDAACRYVLGGTGVPANGASGGGRLRPEGVSEPDDIVDVFVYDARLPMPLESYLPFDRRGVQDRYEILHYTSEIFEQPVSMFGSPKLRVQVQTVSGATDLVAILSEVGPDGSSRMLSIGRAEVHETDETEGWATIEMELLSLGVQIQPGSALRLELTGSAFPLFVRHPNGISSADIHKVGNKSLNIATVAVKSMPEMPSVLELPILCTGQ
ncbi:CocE/NonD family hydrolase [Paenibacillus thalictri]|uniref:CocE/NonD family hydrolase n=2 Tax=Paenibacillus thalictri TaxID=2527873 RepID=A0A4Q9DI83_9BACL|nr:CocE/NonD family hydrolase [Paenibacillus thalictri]